MTQHTPGPWAVNLTTLDHAVVRWHVASGRYGSTYPVCEHVIEQEPDGAEQLANARLIAVAPEQHVALKRLADAAEALAGSDPEMPSHRDTEAEFDAALAEARAVYAKAEGRPE